MNINIAIIGLGRIGSILLQQMLNNKNKGINILAVAEINETPGKILALEQKINIKTIDEIVDLGKKVDLIFELTGDLDVRRKLRDLLMKTNNNYTVIAAETVAILICNFLTDKELPNVHEYKGY